MRVCDKLNRGSDKFIVQYSNVGPELYAVCHIWRVHFYIKSLSNCSVSTIAAYFACGYLASLGHRAAP